MEMCKVTRNYDDWMERSWFAIVRTASALLLLSAPPSFAAPSSPPAGRTFRAGAATSNITPELGATLAAGSFAPKIARHIHDELHARCLVLDDGSTRLAFVVCDTLNI